MKTDQPTPPFLVRASGRECFNGIATEREASVRAVRLVVRGASEADVTDATGWTCSIYARTTQESSNED